MIGGFDCEILHGNAGTRLGVEQCARGVRDSGLAAIRLQTDNSERLIRGDCILDRRFQIRNDVYGSACCGSCKGILQRLVEGAGNNVDLLGRAGKGYLRGRAADACHVAVCGKGSCVVINVSGDCIGRNSASVNYVQSATGIGREVTCGGDVTVIDVGGAGTGRVNQVASGAVVGDRAVLQGCLCCNADQVNVLQVSTKGDGDVVKRKRACVVAEVMRRNLGDVHRTVGKGHRTGCGITTEHTSCRVGDVKHKAVKRDAGVRAGGIDVEQAIVVGDSTGVHDGDRSAVLNSKGRIGAGEEHQTLGNRCGVGIGQVDAFAQRDRAVGADVCQCGIGQLDINVFKGKATAANVEQIACAVLVGEGAAAHSHGTAADLDQTIRVDLAIGQCDTTLFHVEQGVVGGGILDLHAGQLHGAGVLDEVLGPSSDGNGAVVCQCKCACRVKQVARCRGAVCSNLYIVKGERAGVVNVSAAAGGYNDIYVTYGQCGLGVKQAAAVYGDRGLAAVWLYTHDGVGDALGVGIGGGGGHVRKERDRIAVLCGGDGVTERLVEGAGLNADLLGRTGKGYLRGRAADACHVAVCGKGSCVVVHLTINKAAGNVADHIDFAYIMIVLALNGAAQNIRRGICVKICKQVDACRSADGGSVHNNGSIIGNVNITGVPTRYSKIAVFAQSNSTGRLCIDTVSLCGRFRFDRYIFKTDRACNVSKLVYRVNDKILHGHAGTCLGIEQCARGVRDSGLAAVGLQTNNGNGSVLGHCIFNGGGQIRNDVYGSACCGNCKGVLQRCVEGAGLNADLLGRAGKGHLRSRAANACHVAVCGEGRRIKVNLVASSLVKGRAVQQVQRSHHRGSAAGRDRGIGNIGRSILNINRISVGGGGVVRDRRVVDRHNAVVLNNMSGPGCYSDGRVQKIQRACRVQQGARRASVRTKVYAVKGERAAFPNVCGALRSGGDGQVFDRNRAIEL